MKYWLENELNTDTILFAINKSTNIIIDIIVIISEYGNSIILKVILYVKYLVTRGSNPIPGKNFILFGILYCIYWKNIYTRLQ